MKKRFNALITGLSYFLLCSVLATTAYSKQHVQATPNDDVASKEEALEPHEKIHFYFDDNQYAEIDSEEQVVAATEALKLHKNDSAITRRGRQGEVYAGTNSSIEITVEFVSNISATARYKELVEERNAAETIAEKRVFRERLNAYAEEYHSQLYLDLCDRLTGVNYEKIEHITYTPFVTMSLNFDDIDAQTLIDLSEDEQIEHISLSDRLNFVSDETTTYSTTYSSWSDMLSAINASNIVNSGTYTGDGIRVGVFEANGVCDTQDPYLDDIDITIKDTSDPINDHATKVTSVIALMAPDAEYYVTSYDTQNNTVSGYTSQLHWLLQQGCDVINCSFGIYSSTSYMYNVDAVFDYFVEILMVPIVVSAGNVNSSTSNIPTSITSPAFAYNVITVGGVNAILGNRNNYVYDSDACYRSNNETKPTVSAVYSIRLPNNSRVISGTSIAAPQVTGAIALLFESNDDYIFYPEKTMATIIACADRTYDYEEPYDFVQYDEHVGSGIINLSRMIQGNTVVANIIDNDLSSLEVMSQRVTFYAGDEVQIGLSWMIGTDYEYHSDNSPNVNATELYITDYDLFLYDANGNLIASSEMGTGNCELIRCTISETRQYRIVVYQYGEIDDENDGDFVGLSYNTSG